MFTFIKTSYIVLNACTLTDFAEMIVYSHNAAFNYLINTGSQTFSWDIIVVSDNGVIIRQSHVIYGLITLLDARCTLSKLIEQISSLF